LDRTTSEKLLHELIQHSYGPSSKPIADWDGNEQEWKGVAELISTLFNLVGEQNVDIIFNYSESPAETIFLGAINLGVFFHTFLREIPPMLVFHTPSDSASEYVSNNRGYWKDMEIARKTYIESTGKKDTESFIDFCIESGLVEKKSRKTAIIQVGMFQNMRLGTTYQLMPQARFPEILVDGKSIRTDAYIWNPLDDKFNLILECDGYEYHSTRNKFSNDRIRDRILKAKGFDVMRFSGSEINRRPIEISAEVIKYLERNMSGA
jgi:hypothetical protein